MVRCRTAIWARWAATFRRFWTPIKSTLARGTEVMLRGQVETMQTSFRGCFWDLPGPIVLVYLLIVVNFQCWLDPFIIITALPARTGWDCDDAVCDAHNAERAGADGRDYVHGRGHGQQYFGVSFAKERLHEARQRD